MKATFTFTLYHSFPSFSWGYFFKLREFALPLHPHTTFYKFIIFYLLPLYTNLPFRLKILILSSFSHTSLTVMLIESLFWELFKMYVFREEVID